MLKCYLSIHTILRVIARIKVHYSVYHHWIFRCSQVFLFYSNDNAERCIKNASGVNDAMIMYALLPCSVTLARQLNYPDTRHVISWGTRRQHGGTPSLMETTAEALAPLFTQTADISASHMNTAHVVHASRWQKKEKKIAIMQSDYFCKYCNYKTCCTISQTVATRKCRNTTLSN